MLLSQGNDLGQTLGLDRTNESLRVCIQIRASGWKLYRINSCVFQDLAKRSGKERISIMDDVASLNPALSSGESSAQGNRRTWQQR